MKCQKPCAGCPWRTSNQTPEAIAASPVGGTGEHWFEPANLARHWEAARTIGSMLPCHETDENAPFYGGKATRAKQAHICAGLSILAKREVRLLMETGQQFEKYERAPAPGVRMLAGALASWAARLLYAGAYFHMGGRSFRMPAVNEEDPSIGLPEGISDEHGTSTNRRRTESRQATPAVAHNRNAQIARRESARVDGASRSGSVSRRRVQSARRSEAVVRGTDGD